MTKGFAFISIIALISYVFLFLTFTAAKKNRLIRIFMMVLVLMILWTGGSFCMRAMMWPGITFWYNVSIFGLTVAPYGFFLFSQEFIGVHTPFWSKMWIILACIANGFNILTGALLAPPELVTMSDGSISFIYHTTWKVLFLYGVTFGVSAHMFYLLWKQGKQDEMIRRQFMPIVLGILLLYAGNIIIFLPVFRGFPFDILAGIVMVCCLFYVLYARRMFKLTLLVSKGSCYVIAALSSTIIFSNMVFPLRRFLVERIPSYSKYDVLIVSMIFLVATVVIYQLLKHLIDKIFIREEIARSEILKEFSSEVSKSLKINEILDAMVQVIQKTIGVKRVYVCLINNPGDKYQVTYSTSPLDKRSYFFKVDNPIISWLKKNNSYLLIKDFRRTVAYKSMWETEKRLIQDLEIECIVPLMDDVQLVGFVMVTGKEKNNSFSYDDLNFLDSIKSISSIAVKNSHLYEKVYMEARIDELTGLLNRKYFYEILESEMERSRFGALSLILISVDDFKLYNQLYGTKEGDNALQQVSVVMEACVGENGHVARYNGKEFAVILPQHDVLAAQTMANNIRNQIMEINKQQHDRLYRQKVLTVSAGICAFPYAASSIRELMDNADLALYQAKRTGKNKVVVYSVGNAGGDQDGQETEGTGYREGIYSEYASTIFALTAAIDTKDHYTFNHSNNVADYATQFARAYGLNDESVAIIHEAALLHDIGKIGIPEHILNKPGRLETAEYETMKQHVENSIGIIRHLPSLDYVIPAVIGHHERWDGNGYPEGLSGESIPLLSRIISVVDAYDAMTNDRSYRTAMTPEKAQEELKRCAGSQFDPSVVSAFLQMLQEEPERFAPEKKTAPDTDSGHKPELPAAAVIAGSSDQPVNTFRMVYTRYIIDEQQKILDVDDEFESITGYSRKDVWDRNMFQKDLLPPEDQCTYQSIVAEELQKNAMAYLEHRLQRKDGTVLQVYCFGRQYFDSAERTGKAEIIVADAGNTVAARLMAENARNRAQNRLEHWKNTYRRDSLTGLLTHAAFQNDVENELLSHSSRLLFLMLDLDHFKEFNDAYGHQAGDNLLVQLAQSLEAALRKDDLAGRMGGDEYAAALFFEEEMPDEAITERALQIFDKIHLSLRMKGFQISCSIGAVISGSHDTFTDLYAKADKALYRSKDDGRCRLTFHKEP